MAPPRKRMHADCHGEDCGHSDCSGCDASAVETAYMNGEWAESTVVQARPKARRTPQSRPAEETVNAAESRDPNVWLPAIDALPVEILRQILLTATKTSGFVQQAVLARRNERERTVQAREQARLASFRGRVVRFRSYVGEVSEIYDKYSSSISSIEYEYPGPSTPSVEEVIASSKDMASQTEYQNSGPACSEIKLVISSILAMISRTARKSYSTNRNALLALCQIGEKVVEGPSSRLGSEVRKSKGHHSCSGDVSCLQRNGAEKMLQVKKDKNVLDSVKSLKSSADKHAVEMDFGLVPSVFTQIYGLV